MASTTIDMVPLRSKLLVHHTGFTIVAGKARAVPVFVLVTQILGGMQIASFNLHCFKLKDFEYLTVNANHFAALIAGVGKDDFITLDAVLVIFLQDIPDDGEDVTNKQNKNNPKVVIPVSSQVVITVMAAQGLKVKFLTSRAIGEPGNIVNVKFVMLTENNQRSFLNYFLMQLKYVNIGL